MAVTPQATVSRALRTPRAAGIAGVVFAALLSTSLVLLRLAAISGAGLARAAIVPQLIPFAGIAFLWFIGVVRNHIGDYEDRFFATIFMGSGFIFVATLFVASAQAEGILVSIAAAGSLAPTEAMALNERIAAVIFHTYTMRMAAVFTISTATIGLRTGALPRWLVLCGYAVAIILLLGIRFTFWFELLFPFWILLLSLRILVENFRSKPTTLGDRDHQDFEAAD